MNLEFRHINHDSYEEMREFLITHEFSWRDSDPLGFVPKTEEKRDHSAKYFMEEFKKPELKFCGICAFDGDKIAGSHFIEIQKIDGMRAAHIHGLWVDQSYRGNGIARRLKEMGEVWSREQNCVLMDSNVRVSNVSMITLNKKMGYEIARYNFRKKLL